MLNMGIRCGCIVCIVSILVHANGCSCQLCKQKILKIFMPAEKRRLEEQRSDKMFAACPASDDLMYKLLLSFAACRFVCWTSTQ
jgi:hypothetical protein